MGVEAPLPAERKAIAVMGRALGPDVLAKPAPAAVVVGVFPVGAAPGAILVSTLRLSAEARVSIGFEAKAGFAIVSD